MDKNRIIDIYKVLFKEYGPQGWWPVSSVLDNNGYHNGNYKLPETEEQKFEIIAGAILTQNTAWKNVRRAIDALYQYKLMNPKGLFDEPQESLAEIIRSSGYFNQKAKKLKIICNFLIRGAYLDNKIPEREKLLSLWGIGPETADSILLYAYKVPVFVVDAYTKRIFSRIGIINKRSDYNTVQKMFIEAGRSESAENKYRLYNEYHALIVKHAKMHCKKVPVCTGCPVFSCKKLLNT